ncbi:MAG: glutathione S-transferase family protein [Minwuia sp.]|uniref:glutathione S-transferase family protein n=1 Tax=Minwuia sp. TaxID=2493630 RepID=UPI003A86D483
MLKLYDNADSGNGYKVRLLLNWLERPFERVELDIFAGASRTPEFLALNPNGRIPTLQMEDGHCLAESGAILFYLAEDTPYWPTDKRARSEVLQWMFFEQYSHEPFIAVLRAWTRHGPMTDDRRSQWAAREKGGYAALDVMEGHLKDRKFLVGERPTIADIALFAYTHVADQGGFDLTGYPAVRAWIARIEELPRHIAIDDLD